MEEYERYIDTIDEIENRIDVFACYMNNFSRGLEYSKEEVFGFGAAQMVPTLAYHIGDSFASVKGLLDDDNARQGMYLPSVRAPIINPQELDSAVLSNSALFCSALDSNRAIVNRINQLSPRRHLCVLPYQ